MLGFIARKLGKVFELIPSKEKVTEKKFNECKSGLRDALIDCDVSLDAIDVLLEKVDGAWRESSQSLDLRDVVKETITEFLAISSEFLLGAKAPATIMLVGSKGCGKTTSAAKLAFHLSKKFKVLLVSLDNLRPAGRLQLKLLADSISVDILETESNVPSEIWKETLAQSSRYDIIICDTAGCIHTDNEAFAALCELKELVHPDEVVLVADSLGGQDALRIARTFSSLEVSSIFLSKADGDSQGAVALSIKHATGKPIRFLGVGEKPQDVEEFDPKRFASRALDLGDIDGLLDKVNKAVDEGTKERELKKLLSGNFGFDDYSKHIERLNKLGGMGQLLGLLPGASKVQPEQASHIEKNLRLHLGIINSMTKKERRHAELLSSYSRKKRIAKGSGTTVREVEALIEQFRKISSMMKMAANSPMAKSFFNKAQ
jgi:signal recognition particle subunit SRP54